MDRWEFARRIVIPYHALLVIIALAAVGPGYILIVWYSFLLWVLVIQVSCALTTRFRVAIIHLILSLVPLGWAADEGSITLLLVGLFWVVEGTRFGMYAATGLGQLTNENNVY